MWRFVSLGHLNNETQGMEAPIIDDALWTLIEPLLPAPKPKRGEHPGRPRVSDRAALNGILFVLKTGIRGNHLPARLGFSSGTTSWRRLDDWPKAGVWDRLHELVLDKLRATGRLDLSHAAVDSSSVRAVEAGKKLVRTPRSARPGSRHHILVDAIALIRGSRGRPLQKPWVVYADRGYDSDPHRQRLREHGIKPVIAKRRTEHGRRLGKFRWVVERIHSWFHNFRRLPIRFDRRADIHAAFLKLGCSLVCWNIFWHTDQPF